MENKLQIFNYRGNDVRTIQINGESWWVLKDIFVNCHEPSTLKISLGVDLYLLYVWESESLNFFQICNKRS